MRKCPWIPVLLILGNFSATVIGYSQSLVQIDKAILLAATDSDIVEFNTVSHKYHDPHCTAAIRCTAHCIKINRAEAKRRGGIPCKLCGGGEWKVQN